MGCNGVLRFALSLKSPPGVLGGVARCREVWWCAW